MRLHVIETGFFKLDGGAMFGVVPKSLWHKINPADENNLCTWAMRCLLIENGNQLCLVDCGIGDKQDARFFSHYYLHGDSSLEKSINGAGFSPDDITDVLLTHLHFDHCGGAIKRNKNGILEPAFKNARYWSNKDHWGWAVNPNAREKASFLKENILPIEESGQLNFVKHDAVSPFSAVDIIFVDGHTEKQMLPKIHYKDKVFVFAADLFPSAGHIPLPYIMSYDVRPLLTLQEKEKVLAEAAENNYFIIFEHDPKVECCSVQKTGKGIRIGEIYKLNDLL